MRSGGAGNGRGSLSVLSIQSFEFDSFLFLPKPSRQLNIPFQMVCVNARPYDPPLCRVRKTQAVLIRTRKNWRVGIQFDGDKVSRRFLFDDVLLLFLFPLPQVLFFALNLSPQKSSNTLFHTKMHATEILQQGQSARTKDSEQ